MATLNVATKKHHALSMNAAGGETPWYNAVLFDQSTDRSDAGPVLNSYDATYDLWSVFREIREVTFPRLTPARAKLVVSKSASLVFELPDIGVTYYTSTAGIGDSYEFGKARAGGPGGAVGLGKLTPAGEINCLAAWAPGATRRLGFFGKLDYDGGPAPTGNNYLLAGDIRIDYNCAPTLTAIATLEGGVQDSAYPITFAALAAASVDFADPDNDPGLCYRVVAVSSGTLEKNGLPAGAGTLLEAGETLTWTPPEGATGELAAFTVEAWDLQDASPAPVQVRVFVARVNHPPTLTQISTLTGARQDEDFEISFATLAAAANEADPDGCTAIFKVHALTSGALTKDGQEVAAGGTLEPGETWLWTPPGGAYGAALDAFEVVATDGEADSTPPVMVTVEVERANQAPTLTRISVLNGLPQVISFEAIAAASDLADVDQKPLEAPVFRVTELGEGTLSKDEQEVAVGGTLEPGERWTFTPPQGAAGIVEVCQVVGYDGELTSGQSLSVRIRASGGIVGPVTATGGGATFSLVGPTGRDIIVPCAAACRIRWPSAVDGSGEALDLAGHALQLVIHDRLGTVLLSLVGADIAGGSDGVVVATLGADALPGAVDARYALWDTGDSVLLHQGNFSAVWVPAMADGGGFTVAGPQRCDLVLPQNASTSIVFPPAKDADGVAFDLTSGGTLRLEVLTRLGRTLATPGSWAVRPGNGSIPAVSFSACEMASCREAHYRVSVVETGQLLYWGSFRVELAPQPPDQGD